MFKVLKTQQEEVTNCIEKSKKCFIQDLTLDGYFKFAKQKRQEHVKQKK